MQEKKSLSETGKHIKKRESKRQRENEGGKCKIKKGHVRKGRWEREGGPR